MFIGRLLWFSTRDRNHLTCSVFPYRAYGMEMGIEDPSDKSANSRFHAFSTHP
tara:strand:+ start:342 stop:500 length:159 start_codon:yes stop_codon:yes gene_type:complete